MKEELKSLHAAMLLVIAEQKLRDLGMNSLADEMSDKVDLILINI